MSPQQQLSCQAERVVCCLPTRDLQMGALIALFVKLTGQPMTCAALESLAAQYACVERTLQLPALIALAVQILANGGGGGGGFGQQVFGGIGPPTITPPASIPWAVYIDDTLPTSQGFWLWDGTSWNCLILQ